MLYFGKRNPGSLTAASPGDSLIFPFGTYNDSGASIGIGGTLAVSDIEVLKDGAATVRATDSGYSLISDTGQVGDRVGLHRVRIQLFNTADDPSFYAVGSSYQAFVDSITVDGRTVRFWLGTWEIGEPRANVVAFNDTGVNDRLTKIQGDVDTGLRNVIADLDTGLRATLGDYDTGIRALLSLRDTGAIAAAVWAKDARTLTGWSFDTGVQQAIARLDTGLSETIDRILVDTDTIGTPTDFGSGATLAGNNVDLIDDIGGIGSSTGSALSIDAETDNTAGGISGVTSGTTLIGSQTGTFANTSAEDLSYHTITHSGNAIDIVYQFLIGAGTAPVLCVWKGYLTGNNDTATISAWNHVSGAWELMATIAGQSGTVNITHNCPLFTRFVGTSVAELGKVYIRLHCTGQTSPVLNTDQIYVSYAVTSADITAIKAKTDSLTFTVAGFADVNIQAVNDVTVGGTGDTGIGTPWGPA
jgi:hypothetical protein